MLLLEDVLGLFGVRVVPLHVVVLQVGVEVGGGLGQERLVPLSLLHMELVRLVVDHHLVGLICLLSELVGQHVRGLQLVQLVDEHGAHGAGGLRGVDLSVLCQGDLFVQMGPERLQLDLAHVLGLLQDVSHRVDTFYFVFRILLTKNGTVKMLSMILASIERTIVQTGLRNHVSIGLLWYYGVVGLQQRSGLLRMLDGFGEEAVVVSLVALFICWKRQIRNL